MFRNILIGMIVVVAAITMSAPKAEAGILFGGGLGLGLVGESIDFKSRLLFGVGIREQVLLNRAIRQQQLRNQFLFNQQLNQQRFFSRNRFVAPHRS